MVDVYQKISDKQLREVLKEKVVVELVGQDAELRMWQRLYDQSRGHGVDMTPNWKDQHYTVKGSMLMCLKFLSRTMEADQGFRVGFGTKFEKDIAEEQLDRLLLWVDSSYPKFSQGFNKRKEA